MSGTAASQSAVAAVDAKPMRDRRPPNMCRYSVLLPGCTSAACRPAKVRHDESQKVSQRLICVGCRAVAVRTPALRAFLRTLLRIAHSYVGRYGDTAHA